jgi:hypothetical protein
MAMSLLTSCSTTSFSIAGVNASDNRCVNKTLPSLLDATDLKSLFHEIALDLCTESCIDCPDNSNFPNSCEQDYNNARRVTILVSDFADIQSFLPNQSGLLMGELMRASLNKVCHYEIIQAEFAKYFKLSEKGLVALTRNASEVNNDTYSQPDIIVGTYNYANNNKVVLFVRRINTATGKISRMVMKEINFSCENKTVIGYTVK